MRIFSIQPYDDLMSDQVHLVDQEAVARRESNEVVTSDGESTPLSMGFSN